MMNKLIRKCYLLSVWTIMSFILMSPAPGLPTTNKKVNVSGLTIYYFKDGKIIGHWQVVDRLGFVEQLGIKSGRP